jgi:hypothetical protein
VTDSEVFSPSTGGGGGGMTQPADELSKI